jgi:hypothetical protein
MDEIPKEAPGSSAPDSRKWIYRIVMAVVLGEAIWNFLVSFTNDLVLPAITRIVGVRSGVKVSNLLATIVELCLAGIIAFVLNSRSRKTPLAILKPTNPATAAVASAPVPVVVRPVAPTSSAMATAAASSLATMPALTTSRHAPVPPATAAKPAEPKPGKKVYYNIVGEPVDNDE